MEAMLEFLQSLVTRAPSAALLLLEQPQNAATCWGMQTCLTLLQDPSPWIRGPAIALVRALQEVQPKSFAHAVLECKEGLRRLLEVVEDKREHIRDAALSVLGQLTGRDKNAQQFLAFEEGFARLFQIIEVEGLTENGASPASTVTADCLQIVNNMVRDNLMTQTLFLEMAYLETHVSRLLRLPGIDGVDEQDDSAALNRRKRVLKLGLQLVRFLVAGLYEGARESSLDELAQRDRARKSQDLNRIQSLVARQEALMGAVDLLRLVSEHNGGVQMILVNLYAWPSGRNALAELVNVDVGNESDDSPVAAAASALLDALFEENEGAQFLCEDEEQQALKMANTSAIVAEGEEGLQMTREQLLDMISKRLGLERFTDALVQFQQTPAVLACARASVTQSSRTILAYRAAYDQDAAVEPTEGGDAEAHYLFMLYERSFTAFYREMAERIQKRVIAIYTGVDQGTPASGMDSGSPGAVSAYQDLIRVQDKQIQDLQQQVEELKQREKENGGEVKETLANDDSRLHIHLNEQLAAQRAQFESEKMELHNKIKSLTDSSAGMETRMNGLTMAYEQLEREHQQRGLELAGTRANDYETGGAQSHLTLPSGVEDQLAALQAELDAELETNRRLRSEASASNGDSVSRALRDKTDAELSNARLMKQLEEMRVESGHKDEQLAECEQMLETLTVGQALVKSENEKLKAQLANTVSLSGQGSALESVVVSLQDDKAQLEHRLEELEAAARAAYEKDQAVLRQRVLEVEQARHAASPTSEGYSDAATDLPSSEGPEQVNTEEDRLKEMVSSQLNELKGLRALVVEMKTVAKEREAQASQATFLQELVAGFDVQTRRDKEKFDATVRELEDELARAFLEKKDAGRKAKAAVKELENEVARLFLAKVELEKELTVHQQGEDGGQSVNDEAIVVNGSRGSVECNASNDSSLDDLLVLVASLEIQCSVLRESLKDAQGEHAVAVAVELSRQRGAVVSV
ncbi:hypothetical protein BBJ29_008459 [Phytophthora kernoviae]|uniref:Vesicle tethering protein Uso1/P115-like head domain-containing protein n=1 Tax=Phytophthora kernoviae TaxID=325452 RepID=A0A3F2RGZ8_9STRA|nr:hypothetical protein BBP00_00008406 [Phytophthora kernoviae]RLN64045.1 hypothetical protein BBJ29_008459 [Phytophthora kernoviae]